MSHACDYYMISLPSHPTLSTWKKVSFLTKDLRMEIRNVCTEPTQHEQPDAESWNQSPKFRGQQEVRGQASDPMNSCFSATALFFDSFPPPLLPCSFPGPFPLLHPPSLPLSSCSPLSLSHYTEPTLQDLFSSVCLLLSIC